MERGELIYLDNAATSYPKPREVAEEMRRFMQYCGGNPGRGAHMRALRAAEQVFDCRERLASFFDASGAEQVVFTMNTTQGLNMAIKGLLCPGDHVLISDIEHNAVYRPIYKLAKEGIVEFDIFPSMICDVRQSPTRICAAIARRLKKNTKMIICSGGCNICSATMPLYEIGRFCRRHGLIFIVDGAQLAGHKRISMREMCIDALAVPGHKGLLGPQGCGALIFGENTLADTLFEGGSGVASLDGNMPDSSPERYEAGTLPTPAIVGLGKGISTIEELGVELIESHEKKLFRLAKKELSKLSGVEMYCPQYEGGVLLFNVAGISSESFARYLSGEGICVRGGYHCNPLAHRTIGTPEGGAVRASFGPFNSSADIEALCQAVAKVIDKS